MGRRVEVDLEHRIEWPREMLAKGVKVDEEEDLLGLKHKAYQGLDFCPKASSCSRKMP